MNITVTTTTNPIEAHIIRGRLEAEGIPAFVLFEHHVWANWWMSQALGGVRVQVPESYVEQAKAVLADIEQDTFQTELDQQQNQDVLTCPNCGSQDTHPVKWPAKLALTAFAVDFLLPYTRHRFKCDNCQHQWQANEQKVTSWLSITVSVFIVGLLIVLAFYGAFELVETGLQNSRFSS